MQFVKLHTQKNTFSESDVAKIRDYWTIGSTSIFVSQQKKEKKGFQQEKVTPDVKSIVKTFDPKTNNISKNEQGFLRKKSLRPQYVFHIKSKSQFNQRSYHSVNVFSVLEKQKEIYILENKETTFVHYSNYVCRTERV